MWRPATPTDDDAIIALSVLLNAEDPGPRPVPRAHVERTLAMLRREPARGTAAVLELDGRVVGYTFLISFWSNELGGDVCTIDELFVHPDHRGHGHGAAMFAAIDALWARPYVALALETTHRNERARALYARLGFARRNLTMIRWPTAPAG